MTDIRAHAVKETAVIHLRDGADELLFAGGDEAKPITVTVFGPGSKTFAKAQSANANRMLDRLKRKGKAEQSAEDKAEETAKFLAACTKSSENLEYDQLQGEALYTAVYSDLSIGFIADQVNKHLGDWANFTKPAQAS